MREHTRCKIVCNYTAKSNVQETLVSTDRALSNDCVEGLVGDEARVILISCQHCPLIDRICS